MTIFSIFARQTDAEPEAVPDRFSWFAALLPPLYALVHGLWLGLLGFVLVTVALVVGSAWIGGDAACLLYLLFAVLVGFEASTLRRLALGRRSFAYRGELIAPNADAAAIAYLDRSRAK